MHRSCSIIWSDCKLIQSRLWCSCNRVLTTLNCPSFKLQDRKLQTYNYMIGSLSGKNMLQQHDFCGIKSSGCNLKKISARNIFCLLFSSIAYSPKRGFLFSLSSGNQVVPAVSSRPDQTRSEQKITEIAENVKMQPWSGLLVTAGTNWSMVEPHKQKTSKHQALTHKLSFLC